ncbi:hypothetical protein NXV57_23965 [Bacteroides thetaiotaomicron]|nr:hypothetical protein [Bacteroides thetaiotaomicron]
MKKLYNNTLMQLILALCTFSFVACQEFDIDSQPEGPLNIQIDALESYTALATSPSNVVFNIRPNTPWTIESDQQWCKPTPSMSAARLTCVGDCGDNGKQYRKESTYSQTDYQGRRR